MTAPLPQEAAPVAPAQAGATPAPTPARSPELVEGPAFPSPPQAEPDPTLLATITLHKPIQQGETQITRLTLRKPDGVHLMGVGSLYDVLRMEVSAVIKTIPVISTPTISEVQAAQMSGRDLFLIGEALSDFLRFGAE